MDAEPAIAETSTDSCLVPQLSIVVPIYNERDNAKPLYEALTFALDAMDRPYEIVLVDDGSDDGTRDVLRSIAASDERVRLVMFRRNYGQTAAMQAGIDARGEGLDLSDQTLSRSEKRDKVA